MVADVGLRREWGSAAATLPDGEPATADATSLMAAQIVRSVGAALLGAVYIGFGAVALVQDPGRIGSESSVVGTPIATFLAVLWLFTMLSLGAWAVSTFRFKTPTLLIQLATMWIGGLLYATGIRTHVSAWDLLEDVVILATGIAQVLPGPDPTPRHPWLVSE